MRSSTTSTWAGCQPSRSVAGAVSSSARSLLRCAELFNAARFPVDDKFTPARPPEHRKIRIGYLGDVFREQAVSYLMVGALELADKSRFELYGFDNGWNDKSETRKRVEAALTEMVDIRSRDDMSAAAAIREREIDILVNLNVYFGDHRTGVLAKRPAPIQANYLGFPATLGASYSDYIIADRWVIPADDRDCYAEKVVYLAEMLSSQRSQESDSTARVQPGRMQPARERVCFLLLQQQLQDYAGRVRSMDAYLAKNGWQRAMAGRRQCERFRQFARRGESEGD
jgi:predicted O-linked N-acetylglucosamine transferase (SPINDLY family)